MSLAVAGATLDGERVGMRAEDGLIAELGAGVEAQPDDEVIDGTGLMLSPPMVNGHTHAAMTLFRGFGDDMALMEWLRTRIWPAEAKLAPEDVYWGTRLACVEMIRSGTTKFVDMYWHGPEVARAVRDGGLRAKHSVPPAASSCLPATYATPLNSDMPPQFTPLKGSPPAPCTALLLAPSPGSSCTPCAPADG